MWNHGTRITHARDMDNNPKYFHRISTERRRMSYIEVIRMHGNTTTEIEEIKHKLFRNRPHPDTQI